MTSQDALTFTYTIEGTPLSVHKGGDSVFMHEIEFTSPTSRNMKECSQLKQAFAKAMVETQERVSSEAVQEAVAASSDATSSITGEDLMKALTISSVPLDKVMEQGVKLLTSGVGTVEDIKFNSTMLSQLRLDEVERMLGEYVLFFVLKSFLT